MAKEINIFGIKSKQTIDSWKDKFDEVYSDDESSLFISKETFVSEGDPGLKDFKYHYVIDVNYLDTGKWLYALRMVIDKSYMHKNIIEDICDMSGVNPDKISISDVLAYGGCDILFGSELSDSDVDLLTPIANVFETMNSLRGFYLDKAINGIGTTGWKVIRHALYNKNLF